MKDNPVQSFHEANNYKAYEYFGAHPHPHGVVFRVFAPNAKEIFLVGNFNHWQQSDPMKKRDDSGIWEVIIANAKVYDGYKYLVVGQDGETRYKADPYGFYGEKRPDMSSKIYYLEGYMWNDQDWMLGRNKASLLRGPLNIYEVHLDSFNQETKGSYEEFGDELIAYVVKMGYTHLELMPISEYPYDPSWGYQVTGFYAPTSRYGTPHQLMAFVDKCHQEGLGVIIDWVPGHFPKDEAGLYRWDGSHLYEYEEEKKRYHKNWGTAIFDWGRPQVKSFLISNALYWLREYHFDGIRMDAVSSMLYLDYDRGHGEWQANIHGGKENLEAVEFLKTLNLVVEEEFPQVLMIAEESTAWPKMTLPVEQGGMGFDYKWNMGWMNDTLKYMSLAEGDRKNNSHLVTFSITYAFGENYILPFSHDEVVHLKKSLLRKMPGDKGEMLENLRAMMGYMMAHPGKKLLFMGGELAQEKEWDFEGSLQWELLEQDEHQEFNEFMQALNHFYKSTSSLWERDTDEEGFQWINIENTKEGVVSFQRTNLKGEPLIVIGNFTGKTVKNLALPPWKGKYEVAFSTSSKLGGISITAKGLTIPAYTTGFIRREAH